MTSSRTPLILVVLAFASLALTANAACLRNVDGHVFNLCPFDSPINISYNVQPYWSSNFTFALAKPNVPSCQNSTVNGWFSGINSEGSCATVTASEPVFRYVPQITGLPVLKVNYALDNKKGNYTLSLICNQTAPHDTNVNWFVDGVIDYTLLLSGYSYYGCPVKAADNKRFLPF